MMVETPVTKMAATMKVWPLPGVPMLVESGGYVVQPAPAAPSCPKNEQITSTSETANVQNDIMFRKGKAMSRAPIISGMQ